MCCNETERRALNVHPVENFPLQILAIRIVCVCAYMCVCVVRCG